MGFYLNSNKAESLYLNEMQRPYFVDKTSMIGELIPLVEAGTSYICITRPRRFGKTIMASMIASFFGKNNDGSMFDELRIASHKDYLKHRNKHNVIYISFNELPPDDDDPTYVSYIKRIKNMLFRDLIKAYPECEIETSEALWDALNEIHNFNRDEKFIFVLDEWDFVFHQDFLTEKDKAKYIAFLRNLLKDQPYVELAYMTGILPIAKYSSGSELNMFLEYTMASKTRFGEYFGFTQNEVEILYERYLAKTQNPKVSLCGLEEWYDGYETLGGEKLYNPRSIVSSLTDNQLADYWTSSGPYDEIFHYVRNNVAGVRDDIAKMIAGEEVKAQVAEYSAVSTEVRTRDEILSAMVVYGFLTARNNTVRIPNKELMDKFVEMVEKEDSLGYVYRLAKESERMLEATKAGDTATMEAILQQAHDTETDMRGYNGEAELSAIVKLVYLSARDSYDIEREDKAGVGFVDYIFYPKRNVEDDCIIVELKVDATVDDAIRQIKDRKYIERFIGKLGEQPRYTGRILAVGIAYSRKDKSKKHKCHVEVLRERE